MTSSLSSFPLNSLSTPWALHCSNLHQALPPQGMPHSSSEECAGVVLSCWSYSALYSKIYFSPNWEMWGLLPLKKILAKKGANFLCDYSMFMSSYHSLCSFFLGFSPFSLSYFIPLTGYQGLFSDHSYVFLHFIIYLNILYSSLRVHQQGECFRNKIINPHYF